MNDDLVRILVADDDQAIVWLWARILQWGFGAEVVAVFDGRTAIARLEAERFDLIITDLEMPVASGLDVVRSAANHDPRVPVVLSTAHASHHALAEASRLGVREVLLKPFSLDEAVSVARNALAGRAESRLLGGRAAVTPPAPESRQPTASRR